MKPPLSPGLARRGSILLLACLMLSWLPGCARGRYRIQLGMAAENRAVVLITGKHPFVTVRNSGPGAVSVQFEDEFATTEKRQLRDGITGRTVIGPARIIIETGPEGGATVRIEAQRATGLAVHQMPSTQE